jgi:hypothetical protein
MAKFINSGASHNTRYPLRRPARFALAGGGLLANGKKFCVPPWLKFKYAPAMSKESKILDLKIEKVYNRVVRKLQFLIANEVCKLP